MSFITSTYFPKYAATQEEYGRRLVKFRDDLSLVSMDSRIERMDIVSCMLNYICDNREYFYQDSAICNILEERLYFLLYKEHWKGAQIYLDRLFKLSESGKFNIEKY